jgi:hypothetical protein
MLNEFTEIRGGRLRFEGCDVAFLAKEHRTPLYLRSESSIRARLAELEGSFLSRHDRVAAAYASKACQTFALFTDDNLVPKAREHTWRLLETMEDSFARDGARAAPLEARPAIFAASESTSQRGPAMSSYPERQSPTNGQALHTARDRALEAITRAFSSDRITVEEYERRAGQIQSARAVEEVERVLVDLPFPTPASPQATSRQAPASRSAMPPRVDPGLSGSQTVACVMGERQLQGDFLNGNRVETFTLMGSTKIDLRDTAMPEGRLKIEAFVLMGETRVVVPRGLPVHLNVFPFMGEAMAKRDVNQRVVPDEPHVLIEGFVMMGSIVVVAQD